MTFRCWRQHLFWRQLQTAIEEGELANTDLQEWFGISEKASRLWRVAEGPYGPMPASSQKEHWRRLAALEKAIKNRQFPISHVSGRQRREVVKRIFNYGHSLTIPVSDPAE